MIVGIFGAGRNGSTLLMRLLDGSPGLWVYPIELNYLSVFAPRSWRGRAKLAAIYFVSKIPFGNKFKLKERCAETFCRWAARQLDELNRTYVDHLADAITINKSPLHMFSQRVGQSIRNDLLVFLDAVRSAYDDRLLPATPLFAFKSLEVADLHRYQNLFPEMRFVHIIRHPYSNYASLKRTDLIAKQKPFWFQGGDILRTQLEDRWIPHVRFILDARRSDSSRHFVVKYEELCERPDVIVRDICRWLDVAPPADPTLQTVLGGKRMSELPTNPSKKGIKTPPRVIGSMAEEFGYEDVLTDRERELILVRTYNLARQMGFFTEEDGSHLPNRFSLLQKWFLPDEWELMNTSSKLRFARALIARRFYICGKLLFPSA